MLERVNEFCLNLGCSSAWSLALESTEQWWTCALLKVLRPSADTSIKDVECRSQMVASLAGLWRKIYEGKLSCPTYLPLTRRKSNTRHKCIVRVLIKQTGFFFNLFCCLVLQIEVHGYQIKSNLDLFIQIIADLDLIWLTAQWSIRNPCSSFWATVWVFPLKSSDLNSL